MARGMGGGSPSNVTHHLQGVDFPAHRDDLLKQAQENKAEPEVMDAIKNLPDEEYQNMADVMKGFGDEGREPREG